MKIFTWKQRIIVFFTTISVIGAFALVGYLIGRAVNNIALVVMLAVLVSYPFSMFTIARVLKRRFEKEHKSELEQKK